MGTLGREIEATAVIENGMETKRRKHSISTSKIDRACVCMLFLFCYFAEAQCAAVQSYHSARQDVQDVPRDRHVGRNRGLLRLNNPRGGCAQPEAAEVSLVRVLACPVAAIQRRD